MLGGGKIAKTLVHLLILVLVIALIAYALYYFYENYIKDSFCGGAYCSRPWWWFWYWNDYNDEIDDYYFTPTYADPLVYHYDSYPRLYRNRNVLHNNRHRRSGQSVHNHNTHRRR